jgi:hypothetical protein
MKNGERRPRVQLLGLLPRGVLPVVVPLKTSRCAENELDTDGTAKAMHGIGWDSGVRNFLFHLSPFPYLFLIVAIFISSPVFHCFFFLLSHLMCYSHTLTEMCKTACVGHQNCIKPQNY